ncbi:MAG: hypothetical protein ACJARY_003580 [Candidatus Azotimanducaceae bacterium]
MRHSVDLKNSRVEIDKIADAIEFPSFDKRLPLSGRMSLE